MHGLARTLTAAALFAAVAGSASAISVTVTLEQATDVGDAVAKRDAFIGGTGVIAFEDFEGFTSYENRACDEITCYDFAMPFGGGGALLTNVGRFAAIEPEGSGQSEVAPDNAAIIRSASGPNDPRAANDPVAPGTYGRYDADGDVLPGGGQALQDNDNYLDSNDNSGIELAIPSGLEIGPFKRIAMILTDIDDVGDIDFDVFAYGSAIDNAGRSNLTNNPNANIFVATFLFSDFVENVGIKLRSDRGDGFGVDGVVIADPSPVPLPAGAWLMLAGLGALGAAARRKRKAA